ncbi:MAG: PPK2 family polyphosphate kinase [Atopobiaceae bacterium]|jgi:PPK2 family polyphosphate:nucleotide phosphotransferase
MAHTFDEVTYTGNGSFTLGDYKTSFDVDKHERPHFEQLTEENLKRMEKLQDKLYAEAQEGVIIIFQAMDAAGKDSTIKRVMSGINPQGVDVYSFKQPTHQELAHDFLWRASQHVPPRGKIAIFNRSYYEDVLVVRVHNLQENYRMPKRCLDIPKHQFFNQRYKAISAFEQYLVNEGYRVVKFFLHISREEQAKRFLERIDNPDKNWKFSEADVTERAFWDAYHESYEEAIQETSTHDAPWHIIPADQKWYARWLVSSIICQTLEGIDPHYPVPPADIKDDLARARCRLLAGE